VRRASRFVLRFPFAIASASAALCILACAGTAHAGDDLPDAESGLWGKSAARLAGVFTMASGDSVYRQPAPGTTTPPVTGGTGTGTAAPATPAGPDPAYTGLRGTVEFQGGFYSDKTIFGTYIGFEGRAALGYELGPKYGDGTKDKDDEGSDVDGSLVFQMDLGPSYVPLHWRAGIPGRVTLLPGFGMDLDGARFYSSFAYAYLGARLSLFLSDGFSLHGQYVYVPGTTSGSLLIREHRVEASVHIGNLGLGARFHLTHVAFPTDDRATENPQLSAFAAYVFD
jgi:hypothetical protein